MSKGRDELIGRAVMDADFRKRLLADPEKVVAEDGYEIDDELLAQLRNIDPAAAEAATSNIDAAFADRKAAT